MSFSLDEYNTIKAQLRNLQVDTDENGYDEVLPPSSPSSSAALSKSSGGESATPSSSPSPRRRGAKKARPSTVDADDKHVEARHQDKENCTPFNHQQNAERGTQQPVSLKGGTTPLNRGDSNKSQRRANPHSPPSLPLPSSSIPIPTVPSHDHVHADVAFTRQVSDLKDLMMNCFEKYGIKYSVDAQINAALANLVRCHSKAVDARASELRDLRAYHRSTQTLVDDLAAERDGIIKEMRQEESLRVRKQQKRSRKMLDAAVKKERLRLESAYGAERGKYAQIAKYNAKQLKDIESSLKQKMLERDYMKDQKIEMKIKVLENNAVSIMQSKQQELGLIRNELLAERHEKAKIHQTIQKHLSDKQKLQFALKSLKVEMLETKSRVAETEGKNSSLEHELHTSTQAHEQDKQMMLAKYENHIEQSSQFQHTLQTRVRELEKRLLEQKQNHALAEQKESNCHSNEMDRLHQRVKVVMEKKEAQVRALQDKIKNVESRLATTQRMMMAQQEELASI